MKLSSLSSAKAVCDGGRAIRMTLRLAATAAAALVWVVAAGAGLASVSPETPHQMTPAAAFHRGEMAYRHRDYATALRWFRLSGAQGNALAQKSLGCADTNRFVTAQDYDEALRWY